ncbi:LPS-assembly protein LptD [Pelagibius sp. Alg239-R121]|uniref:LPS-assembly protein LptD n=1 Tax=Pelagibius sp. Alg239-R121 TaxID=2993448 RepID=UPI0024A6C6D8|nr:LPS assembly protein LptD [Pelagibius sp. Alg239-R121]
MAVGGYITGWKLALAVTAVFLSFAQPATAQVSVDSFDRDTPALISADQVTFDQELNIVTASGNVEISQGDRIVKADAVSYNINTNVVTATGNVALLEPTGDVVFAEYLELSKDLSEGFIRDIRVLLSDRSRLAAVTGQRTGGNRTVLSKAIFSPCNLCKDDPSKAPLWQLKADRVIHDQAEQEIRYYDARMEFFGIPVAYSPYLSHPDPTVKKKSGFLAPTFRNSDSLGFTAQVPYFWNIDSNQDLTIAPIFTTEQNAVAAAQYRHLFTNGFIDVSGSATIADREDRGGQTAEDRFRGHIDAEGRFDIDETWRWGFDANRSSDDTYLRLYDFGSERTLTSRAFVEGFRGRNYAAVNSFAFQGLRQSDVNDESPIILPMADYNFISEPLIADSVVRLDANLLALTRSEGRDSRRASIIGGWDLPFISPLGDSYKFTAQVQADGYWVNGVDPNSNEVNPTGSTFDGFTGRVFPQLAAEWRYPWVRNDDTFSQVIEPVVQVIAAPNGSNPGEIPNEDSRDFEFDDTNLFSLNRFAGLDRVDSGSRVNYGLKWTLFHESGSSEAFVGQSYALKENNNFSENSGLANNLSDYVGRIRINPIDEVDLLYRFRLDEETLDAQRSEVSLRVGPPLLRFGVNYLFLNNTGEVDEFDDREELTVSVRSQLSEYWSTFASHRRDIQDKSSLETRVGLTYQDECFLIEGIAERTFFTDRDIEPEDTFAVRFVFKHLGEFSTN